jgi:hypothetical protein
VNDSLSRRFRESGVVAGGAIWRPEPVVDNGEPEVFLGIEIERHDHATGAGMLRGVEEGLAATISRKSASEAVIVFAAADDTIQAPGATARRTTTARSSSTRNERTSRHRSTELPRRLTNRARSKKAAVLPPNVASGGVRAKQRVPAGP